MHVYGPVSRTVQLGGGVRVGVIRCHYRSSSMPPLAEMTKSPGFDHALMVTEALDN